MRKQEYVHLHGLLVELARDLAAREAIHADVFAEYESHETSANCVHASKQDHHEAVMFLAATLRTELEQSQGEESKLVTP